MSMKVTSFEVVCRPSPLKLCGALMKSPKQLLNEQRKRKKKGIKNSAFVTFSVTARRRLKFSFRSAWT